MPHHFSIVCPIFNEEKLLSITVPSIYQLNPDEVVFSLDRCVDGSQRIVEAFAWRHPETSTRIFAYSKSDGKGWQFRSAYLRREAYAETRNDTILNTSADIRLDLSILPHLKRIPKFGLISFGYLDYPYNLQSFLRVIMTKTTLARSFAGLIAFSKKAWIETEDLEDLKQIRRAEDTYLQIAIKSKYPINRVNTRSLHLRPNETQIDHYNRGVTQWQMLHRGAVSALLHSLFMLRPACFTGYMHARRNLSVSVVKG